MTKKTKTTWPPDFNTIKPGNPNKHGVYATPQGNRFPVPLSNACRTTIIIMIAKDADKGRFYASSTTQEPMSEGGCSSSAPNYVGHYSYPTAVAALKNEILKIIERFRIPSSFKYRLRTADELEQRANELIDNESEQPADKSPIHNPQSAIEKPPRADLVMIPVDAIVVKDNARTAIDEDKLFRLTENIAAVGQLQPVIVHKVEKKFVMIAGHRRLAAARRNNEDLIEAKVYDTLDDKMVARMQLTENLQRADLNHIDIARKLGEGRDAGMTVAEIAGEINTSDDYVRKHLDLLRLTGPVAELVASGKLPTRHAELIARVGDPKKQIDLAEATLLMRFEPKTEKWAWYHDRIGDHWGKDYIQPMAELRKQVGYAMRGLAAVGWPMDEKFASMRPCTNCPDSTATYADQPALFAGINPRGSAKKGHCTNDACYQAKTIEQNKVRAKRKKEDEKKTAAKIKKAHAAGLKVCADCTKVLDPDEMVKYKGRKVCKKCAEKARKKTEHTDYGETDRKRQERVKALEKKFPWTAEQKFAVAFHDYGVNLAQLIGKRLAVAPVPDNATAIILLAVLDGTFWQLDESLLPALADLIDGGQFSSAALAMLWGKAESSSDCQPEIDYRGNVDHVPLSDEHFIYIDSMERLAKHWGALDLPARPMDEQSVRIQKIDDLLEKISKAGRTEVPVAVHACDDLEILHAVADNAPKKLAKWKRDILVGWINELQGADPPQAEDAAKHPDKKKDSWTIIHGKKAEALAAIAATDDLKGLKMFDGMENVLKGDWRRAAVRKRIEEMEKANK